MQKEENSFGVASVILGILSILLALTIILGSVAGIIVGIVGIVFAWKQRKLSPNKWSTWGLILSIVGLTLNVLITAWIVSTIIQIINQLKELEASGAFDQLANATAY